MTALLLGLAFAAPAEARRALFDADRVVRIDLTVDKKGYDALRGNPREAVRATLVEGATRYENVALRLRGSMGSFQGVDGKPGLTLSLGKFGGGGRFYGMTKFHLLNCAQDPTYAHELVCGELMRAAGVPAARVAHAVVSLNGRVLGLYALKEGYDKGFLREHFGTAAGNLYDGGFLSDIDRPLHRSSGGAGDGDRADLKALAEAAREPDHAKRLARLEKSLDLDRFLALMAVDAACSNWDGYPAKANNYRVYCDAKTARATFIPSGMDQMFADPNYDPFAFGGLVARAIVETKRGRELYVAKLRAVSSEVLKPDAVRARLEAVRKRVQPALAGVNRGAGADYGDRVRDFGDAVARRAEGLKRQVAGLPK